MIIDTIRPELHALLSKWNQRPFWYHAQSRSVFTPKALGKQGEAMALGIDHPNWHSRRVKDVFNIVEASELWVQHHPSKESTLDKQPGVRYIADNSTEKTDIWAPGIVNVNHTHYRTYPTKNLLMYDGLKQFTSHKVTRKSDNDLYLNGKKIAGNATYGYAGTSLLAEAGFLNLEIDPRWAELLPRRYRQPMTGILNEDPEIDILGYIEWLYKNVRYYR